MKKFFYSLLIVLPLTSMGQKIQPLEPTIKAKFPFNIDFKFQNFGYDLSSIIGESDKAVTLYDLDANQLLWTVKAQDLGVKDDIYVDERRDGYVVIKSRGKTPQEFIIDNRSGKILQNRNESWFDQLDDAKKAEIKEKKDKAFAGIKDNSKDNYLTLCSTCGANEAEWNGLKLTFSTPSESNTSAFGSLRDLTVNAEGTDKSKKWKVEFKGKVVRPLCYDFNNSGSMFGKNQTSLRVVGDKLFALYEGVACIDLNSGKLLWQLDINTSDFSIGLRGKQVLGMAGTPLVSGDGVIVAHRTKESNQVKKLDLQTGKVIWASENLNTELAVPVITQHGNYIVCQIGGQLERQQFASGGGASTCAAAQYFTTGNDVMVLDAATGKTIWNAAKNFKQYKDKFEKLALTQIVDGKLMVATEQNLLTINLENGSLIKSTSLENLKLGLLQYMIALPNADWFLSSSNGVARLSARGDVKYAINTGINFGVKAESGDLIRVINGTTVGIPNAFTLINFETGEIYGNVKDTPYPYFDAEKKSFISYDGKATVLKYKFR